LETKTVEEQTLPPSVLEVPIPQTPQVKSEDITFSKPDDLQIIAPTKTAEAKLLLYYIGQMHGTYLLAQNEEGLFIVDQHAAMERVQYEKIYRRLSDVSSDHIELIVPIVLQYTQNEILLLKSALKPLMEWGFEIEEFGQNSLVVRSVPIWSQNQNIQQIVETIMQQILYDNKFNIAKLRESVAISMSCKGSIKANQYINEHEIKQLLVDLCLCEQPYTCPHGRPIIVKLTKYEIEKLFKRVM
ncbi:MAG: DNA mismatch repair endonuclease MutL, partial [Turicibacter sp.]